MCENHISAACQAEQIKKRREDKAKKATVKKVSAVVETSVAAATAPAPAAAAPISMLNFVYSAVPRKQSTSYVFKPERFTEIT